MKTSSRLNLLLLVVFFAVATTLLGGWALLLLTRGSYLTAAISLGIALYCAGFGFQMAYVLWGKPQPRTDYDSEGTVIRPNRCVGQVFIISFSAGVTAAVLYLAFSPFDMVDYTPTGVLRVGVPAFCGFLIVFGIPAIYRTIKHGAESYLCLKLEGFEMWNGHWGSFQRAEWNDVEQVLDHPLRGRGVRREVIVFVLPKGRSAMLVTDAITGDSDALREWVRFYWQHPEYRNELIDSRGLQRLNQQNFTLD